MKRTVIAVLFVWLLIICGVTTLFSANISDSDVNKDGNIDGADLAIWASYFGSTYTLESNLSGTYHIADFYRGTEGSPWTSSLLGKVDFDGTGDVSGSAIYSESGVGTNLSIPLYATYSVSSNGTFSLTNPETTVNGGISSQSDIFIYANVSEVAENGIGMGVKAGSHSYTNSDLNGVYHIAEFYRGTEGSPWTSSLLGKADFDGTGYVNGSAIYSESGVGTNLSIPLYATYSVSSNGTFSLTNPETTVNGGISSQSDIFIYANVSEATENGIGIGVKAGSHSYTNSDLNGVYHIAEFYRGNDGSIWSTSLIGTFYFDGNGKCIGLITYSEMNVGVGLTQNVSGTYSVNSDGTFIMNNPETIVRGGISSDSDIFIYANTGEATENGIGIGIRGN